MNALAHEMSQCKDLDNKENWLRVVRSTNVLLTIWSITDHRISRTGFLEGTILPVNQHYAGIVIYPIVL